MTREIFLALEKHASTSLEALKLVEYDLQQYAQIGEDHVPTTPALYIGFQNIEWQTRPVNRQIGEMEFTLTLVNQTAYGDKQDIKDTTYINHLAQERALFAGFQGKRFYLQDVPGLESTPDTDNAVIVESIDRVGAEPHQTLDTLIVTRQIFRAVIWDYSALPEYQELIAALDCNITIVDNIQ